MPKKTAKPPKQGKTKKRYQARIAEASGTYRLWLDDLRAAAQRYESWARRVVAYQQALPGDSLSPIERKRLEKAKAQKPFDQLENIEQELRILWGHDAYRDRFIAATGWGKLRPFSCFINDPLPDAVAYDTAEDLLQEMHKHLGEILAAIDAASCFLREEKKRSKTKKGRPKEYSQAEDAALAAKWHKARDANISKRDFCKGLRKPISVASLDKTLDRVRRGKS